MPRTKTGVTRKHRHQKVLSLTKGFRGTNNRLYKRSHEALLHAGQYAYIGRKLRKRDMRSLWIVRMNAALHMIDETLNYSQFINLAKKANLGLNRKILADLAATDFATFKNIVAQVRG